MGTFHDLALVCQSLGQTGSRLQMAQMAGEFLAHLDTGEAEIAARFMVGRALPQGDEGKLDVSGRAIWKIAAEMTGGADQGEEIFAAAADFGEAIEMLLKLRPIEPEPTLSISEVSARFAEIAAIEGRHARKRKLEAMRELLDRASALEGKYLAKILIREMRHGMSEGLMIEAIAAMGARPAAEVRRMHMLEGDLGRVVRAIRSAGTIGTAEAIDASGRPANAARPRPLKPMLAAPAGDVAEALAILGPAIALEQKLDGARVQIHCDPGGVRIFSRRLNEITQSLPELVEAAGRLNSRGAILDGEVIAIDADGRPLAFQEVMRRFGRVRDIERLRAEQPLRLFVFDLIALDGELLIDRPYRERFAALAAIAAEAGLELPDRSLPASLAEAEAFYARLIEAGGEGVMAKALESRYTPGVRGRGWLKIKHARTLDLVIVAADWGYGRRKGWLSNYHLAARDESSGNLLEVGKTFKGLTDDEFRAMTERLGALKTEERGGTVFVRPEVVVEVAYSDIQRSPRYQSGMALRFARIVRIRDDKGPEQVDTVAALRTEFDRQLVKPR
ncbi:MAG: ATP-dependent DNA ligase [Candidatus Binatales bacterium]